MIDLWSWAGPEEGDNYDETVIILFDDEERYEVREGTLAQRKATARRLVDLLNKGGVREL
jgi:hypothetical protein